MTDHRPGIYDTGQGWRWASFLCLVGAVVCFAGLIEVRSTPMQGDYVTGIASLFAALAMQGLLCFLGVFFGVLELSRPHEQRHRWCGAACWANVIFVLLVVSWLALTKPAT